MSPEFEKFFKELVGKFIRTDFETGEEVLEFLNKASAETCAKCGASYLCSQSSSQF